MRIRVLLPHPLPRQLLAIALLLAGGILISPANAVLYKWTDANGRVIYSDQAPTGDVKTEIVQGASPPSNPNAVKQMASKEAELKKRQAEGVENAKKADAQRADAAKAAQVCARAQDQLRQLAAEQVVLTRVNEKGERIAMDPAERRKERVEVETYIKANCSGS